MEFSLKPFMDISDTVNQFELFKEKISTRLKIKSTKLEGNLTYGPSESNVGEQPSKLIG